MISAIVAAVVAVSTLYSAPAVEAPKSQTVQVQEKVKENKRKQARCKDPLVNTLLRAGFKGRNVKEAYAIAMRESNGIPSTISNQDYGLFQFNYPSWGGTFDWSQILDPDYNAKAAYKLSNGGKNWIAWGMRDHMQFDRASYGMWSDDQFYSWVIEPYTRYYAQFPKSCE